MAKSYLKNTVGPVPTKAEPHLSVQDDRKGRDLRRWLGVFIGFGVSAGSLWIVLHDLEFSDLVHNLKKAQPQYLPLAVVIYLLSYGVRSLLWRSLLKHLKLISARRLFQHLMLGVMANNLLPARLGEFVRAYMAGKDAGIREAGVLSSIVVERTLDVFWLFAFLSTAFVFPFEATWPVRLAGLTFCVLLGASAFICFSIWKGRQLSRWLISLPLGKKTGRLQGWLTNHLEAFLQVMSAAGSLRSVLQFLAYSMACWIVWAGFLLCILFSFNIEIPFTGLFLLTGIINLAVLIPSAPGYIGPYQFACIMGLGLFGIPKEEALAFSLVLHASWYIPSTLVGMIFLVRLGLSFSQIMDMETGTSQGILR